MPVEVFTTMRTANDTQLEFNNKFGGVDHGFEMNPAGVYSTATY